MEAFRTDRLTKCAVEIFMNCTMIPIATAGQQRLFVDHIFLIHYTKNTIRGAYQRDQLPRLGVNVSIVAGYDKEEIDGHNRACLMTQSPDDDVFLGGKQDRLNMHALNPAYLSQTIKLYSALFSMLTNHWNVVLVVEDDVLVHFEYMPLVNDALISLHNMSIIYAGSYNPKGVDGRLQGGSLMLSQMGGQVFATAGW